MSEEELNMIAEQSGMIVNGYAFTLRKDGMISILNLYHPDCAMVVDPRGTLLETNMDPIEQQIVLKLCEKNLRFMEE